MGDIADYYIEMQMMDCIFDDNEPHEFPYGFHRPLTHSERVNFAKQAQHESNIIERSMRNMTLEQVIRRKNDNA